MNQHKNLINCPTLRIIGNLVTFVAVFSLAAVFAQAQWATNGSNINNTNTGSVGVGTTAPDRKLSVNNTAAQNEEIISVYRPASSNTSAGRSAVAFEFRGDAYSNNPNFYGWNVSASNSVMAKISATPKSYLELGSAIAGIHSSLGFFVSSAGHGGLLERMSILGNGNVGIGATNPTTKLHLMSGTDSASSLLSLDTGVHGGSVFTVGGTGNNESSFDLSVYRAGTYSSRLGVGSAGQLYLQPAGTAFVGIGTTNPATMLHVVGDGTVTGNLTVGGNIAAKYQDVAEWVDSSQELLAGTVVVLDAKRANPSDCRYSSV